MERGANTFPFHNLLPYSKSNEGLFLFFSPSLNWIKEKSVSTLAIRNICDQKQHKISKSVHRITPGLNGVLGAPSCSYRVSSARHMSSKSTACHVENCARYVAHHRHNG